MLGGFDEQFIICGSDVDMCIRAHQRGLKNVYCAARIGYHQDLEQEVDLNFVVHTIFLSSAVKSAVGPSFWTAISCSFTLYLNTTIPSLLQNESMRFIVLLKPVIDVHHRIGLQVEYKPVNDLIFQNRKNSAPAPEKSVTALCLSATLFWILTMKPWRGC